MRMITLFRFMCCILLFAWESGSKEYCHNEEFIADCHNYYNGNNIEQISRQADRAVLMTSAFYGRMAMGTCVKTQFGFEGCYDNVINHAHARCSGQRSCVIRVPDATLDKTKPCNEDLKNYLDASYICVDVATSVGEGASCELISEGVKYEGYISNMIMEIVQEGASKSRAPHQQQKLPPPRISPLMFSSPPCGDPRRPWIIKVMAGQRVNVTLMDFYHLPSVEEVEEVLPLDSVPTDHVSEQTVKVTFTTTTTFPLNYCDKYATFEDKAVLAAVETARRDNSSSSDKKNDSLIDEDYPLTTSGVDVEPVQGGSHRYSRELYAREGVGGGRVLCGKRTVSTTHAFLSRSNEVAVAIHRWNSELGYKFFLRYEAVGCPDHLLHAPSNVWTRRESRSEMVVGCRGTPSLSWRLVCHGNMWMGSEANCSSAGAKDARREDGLPSLSIGASILIILGVSLAIGLTVLLFGLFYMKRRREMEMGRLPESTLLRSVKHPPGESARETSCCAGFDVRDSSLLAPVLTTRTSAYETSKTSSMTSSLGRPLTRRATAYEYVWELQPDRAGRFSSPQLGDHQGSDHHVRPDLVRLHDQRRSDPPTPLNCLILDDEDDMDKHQNVHRNKMADDRDVKDVKSRGESLDLAGLRCTCFMQQQQQQMNPSYGKVITRPPHTSSLPTTPGIDSLYSQVGDRKRTPTGSAGTPCSYHHSKPSSAASSSDAHGPAIRPFPQTLNQQVVLPKMVPAAGHVSYPMMPQTAPIIPPPVVSPPERMCRSCGHAIDRKATPLESLASGCHSERSGYPCCATSSANLSPLSTASGSAQKVNLMPVGSQPNSPPCVGHVNTLASQ